jgi:hypothetical protein
MISRVIVIHKGRILDRIVLASFILILSLSLASGFLTSQNPCSECHQNISENCRFNPTSSSAVLPTQLSETSTLITLPIDISGSGSNSDYRIRDLTVTLTSANGKINIQNSEQTWNNLYPGGKIFFTSTISGVQESKDTLIFELSAWNTHHASTFSDSYTYDVDISLGGSNSQQPAVEPSTRSLYLTEKLATLQLFIQRDIQNLIISSSNYIALDPNNIETLHEGDVVDITITVASENKLEENLTITWSETTGNQLLQLFVSYVPPPPEEVNYYSLAGRILGIISFSLLVVSIVFSGINRRIRSHVDRVINPQKRIRIHCLISWILLILSITHGLLLLLGPYADFLAKPEIILGYLTAVSMFLVSVNGSFRNYILKKIGSNLWRKTHGYYSHIALILCIIHACLIGTEFEIIRSLF